MVQVRTQSRSRSFCQAAPFESEQLVTCYPRAGLVITTICSLASLCQCVCQAYALLHPAEGPYEVFAGQECARALAKMSKDKADCTKDLSGLSDREFEILCDWEVRFRKYPIVGQVSFFLSQQVGAYGECMYLQETAG